mmetsp:Transcript_129398/g.374747  ORF Transcript_129398/g.374747 Transcript_129398/m.374747 type:complete len:278 (-) Transcript_129398:63-896(-)
MPQGSHKPPTTNSRAAAAPGKRRADGPRPLGRELRTAMSPAAQPYARQALRQERSMKMATGVPCCSGSASGIEAAAAFFRWSARGTAADGGRWTFACGCGCARQFFASKDGEGGSSERGPSAVAFANCNSILGCESEGSGPCGTSAGAARSPEGAATCSAACGIAMGIIGTGIASLLVGTICTPPGPMKPPGQSIAPWQTCPGCIIRCGASPRPPYPDVKKLAAETPADSKASGVLHVEGSKKLSIGDWQSKVAYCAEASAYERADCGKRTDGMVGT